MKSELQIPEFVSQRVDLVVTEEETVRLPCLLERLIKKGLYNCNDEFFFVRLDGFTLLWRKDGRIISVGNNILDNVCFFWLKNIPNINMESKLKIYFAA